MKNEVRKAAEGKVVTLYFALNLSGCFFQDLPFKRLL
jgi:hypothetical protein